MDEQQALEYLDRELDAALGGIAAPPSLAPAVLRRTVARPERLPEILDAVGWLAVVTAALAVWVYFAPPVEPNFTMLAVAVGTVVAAAFGFALRCLRET